MAFSNADMTSEECLQTYWIVCLFFATLKWVETISFHGGKTLLALLTNYDPCIVLMIAHVER